MNPLPDTAPTHQLLLRLWKPQTNLPWVGKTKGSADYTWYEIFDSFGDEICSFPGSLNGSEEAEDFKRLMCFILTQVNGDHKVEIDGKQIVIKWD